jgi:hypothetical protein
VTSVKAAPLLLPLELPLLLPLEPPLLLPLELELLLEVPLLLPLELLPPELPEPLLDPLPGVLELLHAVPMHSDAATPAIAPTKTNPNRPACLNMRPPFDARRIAENAHAQALRRELRGLVRSAFRADPRRRVTPKREACACGRDSR